jgi:Ca2+-binding RTX toxin-like protein
MFESIWMSAERKITDILARRSKRRRKGLQYGRATALQAECLEQRHLLAANPITYDAATSSVIIQGTLAADTASVWSDATRVHVAITSAGLSEMASFQKSSVSLIQFSGSDGDDRFANTTSIASWAWGGVGNDSLSGGAGNDRLYGREGDDTLSGGVGDDELYGDDGNDSISGGHGADRLEGGFGDDDLVGGTGDDAIVGGDGHDDLEGDAGHDQLWGQNGNDRLEGGTENDLLYGGIGEDALIGGDGLDELYGDEGKDRLYGLNDNDVLDGGASHDLLYGGTGDDRLVGGDGNDLMYGEAGGDRLWGQNGNDRLDGGLEDDQLYGGADDDTLIAGEGRDSLAGDDGNDLLFGDAGNDTLDGGLGNDLLEGGDGDDVVVAGDGLDQLYGQDGSDRLWGEGGSDTLDGGLGNDLLYGGLGDDSLFGGVGNDELYGEDGNDRLLGYTGDDLLDGGFGNDGLFASSGDDRLIGGEGNDKLYGNSGNDQLWGQNGSDRMDGGSGADLVDGGAGNDILAGGSGDDRLIGADGKDRLSGNTGDDLLEAGLGDDRLAGGAGNDTLVGSDGNDQLYGDDGADLLWGQNGADRLEGGADNDQVYGGADSDTLLGGEGDDQLYGDDGNDLVLGESGNDALEGGGGNDLLAAGTGNDQLVANYGHDVLIGGLGADVLWGQNDEDLVLGGATVYDSDTVKLQALALAWASLAPYATRIQNIQDEAFAAHLTPNVTVFDDAVADEVYGGDGQDWFFKTGYQAVYLPSDVHDHGDSDNLHADHVSHTHSGPVILDHPPALEGFELVSAIDVLNDRQPNESIQSILPHADSPTLQKEHLSLFQLVRYDRVTHYAVQNGAWSDPTTWHNGIVPVDGAHVLVPLGVEVTVDTVLAARLSSVRVDGTLSFDTTRDTELRVDTIVVFDTGTFEMGTAANPIMPNVTAKLLIIDNGPIDRVADPFAIGRGLLSHGKVFIQGAEVTSYATLAGPVTAGSQLLRLATVPMGWKAGDTLVLAGTTGGTTQNEVRRIIGIVGDLLMMDRPLDFNHVSPAPNIDVHVANVTRNAVIESESTALDRRGHVMFMHNVNVHIGYAGFYHLGRTNKLVPINDPVVNADWTLQPGTGTNPRARYSVHFHRAGLSRTTPPATVIGSAVVDSPGWGYVNHSSHVDMDNNVAYDVHGAAFTTEVGDEIGNFRGNLAIGTSGSGEGVESRQYIFDFGHRGDGFWFQGVGVNATGNIAAGNQGSAFIYYARALEEGGVRKEFLTANLPDPSIAQGAATIDVGKMPVMGFANNVGYASGEGLSAWYLLEKGTAGLYNVLQDSLFWNNTDGVDIPYTHSTILQNLRVIYEKQGQEETPSWGVRTNSLTRDIAFNNLTVTGYVTGILLPRRGFSVVNGGTLNNRYDILVYSGIGRNALITGFQDLPRIVMSLDMRGVVGTVEHVLLNDVVMLNFGPFVNQQLYYTQQTGDFVVFPQPSEGVPAEYIGLTNRELWDQFGVALGGQIAPSNVYTVEGIEGLIGPAL